MEVDENSSQDLCRVCRSEGGPDRPLFHPCICTGSIKYIHQECLLQWLKYSKKDICELCNHRFSFTFIYSSDMPKRLPLSIVVTGVLSTVVKAVKVWMHDTLVALAWIGILPLIACRIYRTLFTGSISAILSLPLNIFSMENVTTDIIHGFIVVLLTLLAFIGLFWLRDQMLHGGGPEWLDIDDGNANNNPPVDIPLNDDQLNNNQPNDDNNNPNENINEGGDLDHLPVEPAAPEILDGADGGDDGQWNPMEWDRAAEEITWERIFGFDGSLVFLEHVFWAISLNTLFILVFALCPYHIGHFTILGFKLKSLIGGSHFEGLLTTLYGYCISGVSLVIIHSITSFLKLRKISRCLGQCYVVVKVALLLVIEIFAFPVVCGWWLDICSLFLFDATLKDRQASYHKSPETSLFMHWLVGMIYVFYFASYVILLREILRPGVLWFIRNLTDADFNPIQEMIHLSVILHLKRFCASLVMFGTSILIMLYIPSRIIKYLFVDFLPYQTDQPSDSSANELMMELFLVLVILPTLQDHNNMREWLKKAIRYWCVGAAYIFDLKSYFFGDETDQDGDKDNENGNADNGGAEQHQPPPQQPVDEEGGLRAAHLAFHLREGPTRFQPYVRPRFFHIKIIGLVVSVLLTWLIVSLVGMLVPVWFGRKLFALWLRDNTKVYELYTLALGLLVCLSLIKGITLLVGWIRQGWKQLSITLKEWGIIGMKAIVAVFLSMGVVPVMAGVLVELILLMPLRVPMNQTPVFIIWQDLAFGVLYTKITIGLTRLGPDWWLKTAIIQLCADGIRGLNLTFLIQSVIVPVCTVLGLSLSIPYIIAHSIAPLLFSDQYLLIVIQRCIYAFCVSVIVTVFLIDMQLKQFKKLYEHIKNDRYLIGRRLVNYNHNRPAPPIESLT